MDQQSNSDLFPSQLKFDDKAKVYILGAASWAMIVVTTTVIGYALSILQLFVGNRQNVNREEGFGRFIQNGGSGVGETVISIIVGLIFNYFLYQFVVQSRKSIAVNSTDQLASGFRNLRIYFMATTIIMIIVFLIALLAFLVMV